MTITEISMAEVGKSVREMAEEAGRAAMEAVDASIFEVTRAAEAAQVASQQAIAQAEEINKSVREMAEEVMRAAIETTETARMLSQQAINRSEEFSKSAKERVEEAARVAREAVDSVIREATKAAETAQATLRQAACRSEEIDNLVEELTEQATKSAREAVESAKIAFQESLSRSINRSGEAQRLKELEGIRKGEAEEVRNRVRDAVERQDEEQAAVKTEPVRRAPWIVAIGNSLKKPLRKTREPEESRSREEKAIESPADEATAAGHEESMMEIGTELYEGLVRIGVASEISPRQLEDFENQLRQMDNLKVLWTGGSENEGTSIVISLQKPTALICSLNALPAVESTGKEGERLFVTLKDVLVA